MTEERNNMNSAMDLNIVSAKIDTYDPIEFIINEADSTLALTQKNEWYEAVITLINQEEVEAVIKVLTMFKDKVKKE